MGLLDKAANQSEIPELSTEQSPPQSGGACPAPPPARSKQNLHIFIQAYLDSSGAGAFQGIVLTDFGKTGYANISELNRSLSHFGSACTLPRGKCLILIPAEMDRELLAHRFSKNARVLCQFSAASLPDALENLRPYL